MNENGNNSAHKPAAPGKMPLRIALVGPCSSGKSTLARFLKAQGYDVRQPAQEHSYVPAMWQRISKPDLLIFLDLNHATMRRRRPHHDGGTERLAEQHKKLTHARANCDFYLDTSDLTPEQVQQTVLSFLRSGAADAAEQHTGSHPC